jgi:hypothetical protein
MLDRTRSKKSKGLVENTVVVRNQKGSKSLRSKIPPGVTNVLDLKPGDGLEWEIVFREGSKVVEIRKKSMERS